MARRKPPEDSSSDWVCLGVFGAPKGVRGALRLTCFNENPAEIASFNPLHAGPGGETVSVRVIEQPKPGLLVVKVEGVADRDAAALLNGTELCVRRDALSAPDEDEFYHHDLIGMTVERLDGAMLGTVKAVFDHGAGDYLEVLQPDSRSSFMLPFTRQAVPTVDLVGRKVVAAPPEGLLDDA
ncbi:MAG: 16S rRNA processing protein RimM [Rhodospirillaceae bacterium]|nr:16S rRNA processing protein RimM [Rhodospirillaceae bacterium]|tara:strand:+ start:2942 stop:3487 length:546 start_codon:yes stop_codon:yes gene_type:complete